MLTDFSYHTTVVKVHDVVRLSSKTVEFIDHFLYETSPIIKNWWWCIVMVESGECGKK
ncbi:MAG: hypothetical protein F6K54_15180 [Okeania sp. SIO3B5]|uniref:hypothetical protein n=1 Tax=Okeania sp. SIO3B5 TaxID=2607811 RepID=UPI0014019995|nr:hypothetical protein [Okeania sp. SIO3B5]NEO54309.1 hypothetical protein [Okeania sp. SIO3B5]